MWILMELSLGLVYGACFGLATHALADTSAFRLSLGGAQGRVESHGSDTGLPTKNIVIFAGAVMLVVLVSFIFGIQFYHQFMAGLRG